MKKKKKMGTKNSLFYYTVNSGNTVRIDPIKIVCPAQCQAVIALCCSKFNKRSITINLQLL